MIRKKYAQKLGLALVAMMAVNSMPITIAAAQDVATSLSGVVKSENIKFNQLPKNMTKGDGKVEIVNSVNIIGYENADVEAVELLKKILSNFGIIVNDVEVDGATTIFIGEADDNNEELNKALESIVVEDGSTLAEDGYVLTVKDKAEGDEIVINGKNERGTYYGVQTLSQILEKEDAKVVADEFIIRDEPSMKLRAVVEGFYGTPWSHADRLDQFKLYGENKINAYIYAPKDDPYHRDKWREPYPEADLARMQELINTANENKVDFVFAISPGLDIKLEEGIDGTAEEIEADFQALISKSEALYKMGVRSFSILWDDIHNLNGKKQAEVLNRFNKEFIQKKNEENKDNKDGQVTPLITVPVEYWGTSMFEQDGTAKTYTSEFAATLDKDIEVMWTGQDVVPQGVSNSDASTVSEVYGKKMSLWWNYPVNDYMTDKMGLGPMYGLDVNLDDHVSGFVINPMEFAEASKISTITGADYAWNTKEYDYNRSWDVALDRIAKDAKDSFKVFADHSTRLDTGRPDSPELNALIETLWNNWENNANVDTQLNILMDDFVKIKETPAIIRETLANKELISEINNQLNKFEKYGEAGIEAVNMLRAIQANDINEFWSSKYKCTVLLREIDGMQGRVANLVVDPFIRRAHEEGNRYFDANTTIRRDKEYTYNKIDGNMEFHKFTSWYLSDDFHSEKYMFDDKMDTGFWSNETVKTDDFVGFELSEVEDIKNISLKMGQNVYSNDIVKKGVIEYSTDGVKWETLKELTGTAEIVVDCDVKAKYIRVRATEDTENKLFIKDFKVNTDKNAMKSVGTVSLDGITVEKSVEGIEEVATLTKDGGVKLKAGESVGICLEEVKNIVAVDAKLKGKAGNIIIETSFDNVEWTKVSDESSFRKLKPVVGKYFRITAVEDVEVESLKVYSEGRIAANIDTNIRISTNQQIKPEYMIDDDYGTTFVCSDAIEPGKYVTLDFGQEINIRDIKLIQGPGEDFINKGKLEYSSDGQNWTEIPSEFGEAVTVVKDLDINARYLKMESTGRRDRWLRIREFSVNNTTEEYVSIASKKGTYVDRVENIRDNNLYSAYIPEENIEAGDYLLYRIFDNKLTSKVTVAQGEGNISNARVIANTVDGENIDLGKLEKGYNEFNLNIPRQIVSIKLIWDENVGRPEIYEVKPTFVSVDSYKEAMLNKIIEAQQILEEMKDKNNKERAELIEAISNLRSSLDSVEATEDEIMRAYENLINKIELFRNSSNEDNGGDIVDPDTDGNGGDTDTDDNGGDTGSGNGGNSGNGGDSGNTDKPTGDLPFTGGAAGGAVTLMLGTAMAISGVKISKRKKNKK